MMQVCWFLLGVSGRWSEGFICANWELVSACLFVLTLQSELGQRVMLFWVSWNPGILVVVKRVHLLSMGANYLLISVVSTVLSYAGLGCWTALSPEKLKPDGSISQSFIHFGNAFEALELLLGSYTSIALVVNFAINIFILTILSLKVKFLLYELLNTIFSCGDGLAIHLHIFQYMNIFLWWKFDFLYYVDFISFMNLIMNVLLLLDVLPL